MTKRCGAYAEHGLGPDGKGCPQGEGHDGHHGERHCIREGNGPEALRRCGCIPCQAHLDDYLNGGWA